MQRFARKQGRAGVAARARYLSMHPLCEYCQIKGILTAAEEVDHRVPLHKGGDDTDLNKAATCIPCHKAKTAADLGYVQRGGGADGFPTGANHPWNK